MLANASRYRPTLTAPAQYQYRHLINKDGFPPRRSDVDFKHNPPSFMVFRVDE